MRIHGEGTGGEMMIGPIRKDGHMAMLSKGMIQSSKLPTLLNPEPCV